MSEKFITPCELPSPYERELLTILNEECLEVAQRACKMLRFGRDEIEPGKTQTNMERLSQEIGDLMALIYRAREAGLVEGADKIVAYSDAKLEKLAKYMQTEPDK